MNKIINLRGAMNDLQAQQCKQLIAVPPDVTLVGR